jgi:hypothetical protein
MATVQINSDDVNSVNSMLSILKLGSKDAIIFATNDSLAGIKTEAAKFVGGKITPKASIIKSHFLINKMKKSSMSANITCSGKPLPLIAYSAKSVNKGVTAKVLKAGGRKLIKHAFIAKVKAGQKSHTGVFWRQEKHTGRVWPVGKKMKLPSPEKNSGLRKFQLKITERYGPRIPDVFDDPEIMGPVMEHASKRYDDRLEYHTNRLLEKAR